LAVRRFRAQPHHVDWFNVTDATWRWGKGPLEKAIQRQNKFNTFAVAREDFL